MIPFINLPFSFVANALGSSVDELKLVFSFLLSYPLAAVLKRIPDSKPWQKNLFIIGVSIFYLIGLFDLWGGLGTILLSSVGAYLIAALIDGPLMPWIGFTFLMGHLAASHLKRQFTNDPTVVDITGPQMVLVMKLTAFCWNVHDGRLSDKDLTDQQRERAIKRIPGLLNYAAYVLFFPALFAGPAFDYVEYRRWIDTTMFDLPPGVDQSFAPKRRKKRRIPRSGTPATMKALVGLFWVFVFLKLSAYYWPGYLLSTDYLKHGLLKRIFILYALGFVTRTKYYGVWYLTEGACILTGIGFKGVDPKTGKIDWNRLQNVKPLGIEMAQNSYDFLGYWNINTNYWLRTYVYLRVTPKGKRPGFGATMVTFVTSAFWHGFYPGYYMSFVLASFIQTIAKDSRRLLRPIFLAADGKTPTSSKRYYDVATWLVTQSTFSFAVAPFIFLGLSDSVKVWARVNFFCLIGIVASFAFLASPGKVWLRQCSGQSQAARDKLVSTAPIAENPAPVPSIPLPEVNAQE